MKVLATCVCGVAAPPRSAPHNMNLAQTLTIHTGGCDACVAALRAENAALRLLCWEVEAALDPKESPLAKMLRPMFEQWLKRWRKVAK